MVSVVGRLVQAQNSSPTAQEIIRKSVERDHFNFEQRKNYTYIERSEERDYDTKGKLKHTEIETVEVMILGGRPYEKLIEKNDKPLSEKEARKEQEKLDREAAKREHESASEKAKLEKERQEQRKYLREFAEAFDFRLTGEENVSGQPAWVIEATPKSGFHPESMDAKVFTKVRGKLWIDKTGYQWVKVEGEVIDTLSFALFLFRIAPGSTLRFEQKRINDEIWLPSQITIRGDARLGLVKKVHGEIDVTYRDYKKFQADSKIVATEEKPELELPLKKN